MKSSQTLVVKTNLYLKDDIILHPNEGYDLGLMLPSTPVKIFSNSTIEVFNKAENGFMNGNVLLENKCTPLTIEIAKSFWKKIGSPDKVKLFYKDNKILVASM